MLLNLGLGFVGDYTCNQIIKYSKLAEKKCYTSLWISEDLSYRDAITPIAALAMSTHTVKLATGILPVYYRSPALTAMTFATLDELSKGRIICGIGNGARRYIEQQGIPFRNTLATMREYVQILRRLWTGKPLNYKGKIYELTKVKLVFKPIQQYIPIYLAARRSKMLQLTGEVADGVILSDGFCAPKYIKWALENIKLGAEKTGRSLDDIDITAFVVISAASDYEIAKQNVKSAVLSLLINKTFDPHLHLLGFSEDEFTPIRKAWLHGKKKQALRNITDTILEATSIYGTPDDCKKKLKSFRSSGVTTPIIIPQGKNIEETIRLIIE